MTLLEAFEQGKFANITELPEKIIETQISKIFLYKDKVRKVYKPIKAYFGDFSDTEFRKIYYEEDFSWNNLMSPHVYTSLVPVVYNKTIWTRSATGTAEDFYIEMEKIDTERSLTNLLGKNTLSVHEIEHLANVVIEKSHQLTDAKKHTLTSIINIGWKNIFLERLDDLINFCGFTSEVPKEYTNSVIPFLKDRAEKNSYLENYSNSKLFLATDFHSDNIFFINNEIVFIDAYLPKKLWSVVDLGHSIARLSVDIEVLGSKDLANSFYKSASHIINNIPKDVITLYELENAIIKEAYYFIIKKPELAVKYTTYIQTRVKLLR